MKIEIIKDREQWTGAVLALKGTLYHSWESGETRVNQGWRPWRVLGRDEHAPRAAIQSFEREIPLLRASVLYAATGIAGNDTETAVVNSLALWMREFGNERKAILLRVESRFGNEDESRKAVLRSAGFRALDDSWTLWSLSRRQPSSSLPGDAICGETYGLGKSGLWNRFIGSAAGLQTSPGKRTKALGHTAT